MYMFCITWRRIIIILWLSFAFQLNHMNMITNGETGMGEKRRKKCKEKRKERMSEWWLCGWRGNIYNSVEIIIIILIIRQCNDNDNDNDDNDDKAKNKRSQIIRITSDCKYIFWLVWQQDVSFCLVISFQANEPYHSSCLSARDEAQWKNSPRICLGTAQRLGTGSGYKEQITNKICIEMVGNATPGGSFCISPYHDFAY